MSVLTHTPTTGRRALLLVVAALMCAAAALAIGILLFGDFGDTEGRVLVTTFLLALHGAIAVPAAILRDQRRLPALALLVAALATLSAALNTVSVWWEDVGDAFGKTTGTVAIFLIVAVVTAVLAARPLHRLFFPSVAFAVAVATMAAVALWAEIDESWYLRVLGALVVLDVLLVALQPLLLRLGREEAVRPLRLVDTSGRTSEVEVPADSVADAVARAIRGLEREGAHIRSVEVLERTGPGDNGATPR
ncbi:MAG: hypothetical protein ACYC1P_01170 [Gaiellaceae bacterium]